MKQLFKYIVTTVAMCAMLIVCSKASPLQDRSPQISTLIPASDEQPAVYDFTTLNPGDDWFKPDFDSSAWPKGQGGFGFLETPGAAVGTSWNTEDIWLRRQVELPVGPWGDVRLWIRYDEEPQVYINGALALRISGWSKEYETLPLTVDGRAALKSGKNIIAVHCHQTSGGQFIDLGFVVVGQQNSSPKRWSADRVWKWYNNQPQPIGFNYIPTNSISYTQMWMADAFDPALIDGELALAQGVGFNCLRVVLPFVVWEAEPAALKQRIETFLALSEKHGIKVMVCFFDDCVFGPIIDPVFGKQAEVVVGWYANGWTPSPGHQRTRDPQIRPMLEQYVKDVMTAHREDPRILCWDLYNEPGNSGMGNATLPLLRDAFDWAREIDPVQPVTSGIFGGQARVEDFLKRESDLISFHNYNPPDQLRRQIRSLKELGRPLICTEWLNRPLGSTPGACLPVFVQERVGALNWGLVNGRTQTHLPWEHRPGPAYAGIWQHDLFKDDHSPYSSAELDLFRNAISETANAIR